MLFSGLFRLNVRMKLSCVRECLLITLYDCLKVPLANREISSHFYAKREFVPREQISPLLLQNNK